MPANLEESRAIAAILKISAPHASLQSSLFQYHWYHVIWVSLLITYKFLPRKYSEFVYSFRIDCHYFKVQTTVTYVRGFGFIARLNVEEISTDISGFAEWDLQCARFRISTVRENYTEPDTLCCGIIG